MYYLRTRPAADAIAFTVDQSALTNLNTNTNTNGNLGNIRVYDLSKWQGRKESQKRK